jgi:hypothetical protein
MTVKEGRTMDPTVKFIPGELGAEGKCIYRTNEFMLTYEAVEPNAGDGPKSLAKLIDQQLGLDISADLLLIADTLTLTFRGEDHHLVDMDSYTNRKLWQMSSVGAPTVGARGSLVVAATLFPEADRLSLATKPRYEVSGSHDWVRIVLQEQPAHSHYEIATNMLVGLRSGEICDIFLFDVEFL